MTSQSESSRHRSEPGVSVRTLVLSIFALAVPVVAAGWFPVRMEHYEALLWLLALVPAFLLAFERGWRGATTALALGMAVLSITYVGTHLTGSQVPETLFPVVVAYIAISLGLGWFGAELEQTRESTQSPDRLIDEETKLPTWTFARKYLEGEFEAARRGRALVVVLFELSEEMGRREGLAGAGAVVAFAEVLGRNTRKMNVTARQQAPAAHRFLSILTGGDIEGASVFAYRVLSEFRETADPAFPIVSAGIAAYRPSMESVDSLLGAAAEALKDARRASGDRVRVMGTVVRPEAAGERPSEEPVVGELEITPESRAFKALMIGHRERLGIIVDALEDRAIEADWEQDAEEAAKVLHHPYDIVVIDLVSTRRGPQLVRAIRQREELAQILAVVDQESAVAGLTAMNMGVDYCLVQPLSEEHVDVALDQLLQRRDHKLRASLEQTHLTGELAARHREVQRHLRVTEERHRAVLERIREVVFEIDADGRWRFLTPAWERLSGQAIEDSLGVPFAETFDPADGKTLKAAFRSLVAGDTERLDMQVRLKENGGGTRWVALTGTPSFCSNQELCGVYGTLVDVTDRRRLEVQLRQAQKMEAIGQLAGGIAHDFNNLLLAIRGHAEFVLEETELEPAVAADIEIIVNEAKRASGLTRQLLAFSREHVPDLQILDLREIVEGMQGMLTRLLGENIETVVHAPDRPLHVEADEAQVQQVVMNLATNARDAMPNGGRLVLRLESVEVDRSQVERWGGTVEPGEFVLLAVHDTGTGIDDYTVRKVFDPFFTTKPVGKGTGLGLSTVLGIVTERRGYVELESEEGEGTEFRVFLPSADGDGSTAPAQSLQPASIAGAGATILVVEDEKAVRSVVRRHLEASGHRVHEAGSAAEALQRIQELGLEHLDLLVTDVVMPGRSGVEFAESLREDRPDLPVVFMSGYAEDETLERGHQLKGGFLNKPFDRHDLLTVVAGVLEPRVAGQSDKPADGQHTA